jgi:tripeptide aminopeptidase
MNAERLLATFLELVRIDSPSLKEADVAAYCKQALEQAGCTVRIDDSAPRTGSNTGNLIAILSARGTEGDGASGANEPSRWYFSAHMDTVSPGEGIEPVITDGIITSAGETVLGGDDKVGVAAILELVRTLAEEDQPHPEIGVLLSVGEEIGLRGAQAMDATDFDGEPCFVLDANGKPGTVIIGAPYHYLFTATFSGKAAHAGIEPEKGVSAIALASKAILAMELGRLDEHTTANVGIISGGHAFNIVPDHCVVTGEFRAMDKQRADEVKAQLSSAIDAAVASVAAGTAFEPPRPRRGQGGSNGTGGVDNAAGAGSVTVEWEEEYPGFEASEDSPLVQLVLEQARALGLPTSAVTSGGGSDANIFSGKGLRPLVLGTGMTDVHGPGESLAIEDMTNLARLCISIAYAAY